jgi:hypothetical protein
LFDFAEFGLCRLGGAWMDEFCVLAHHQTSNTSSVAHAVWGRNRREPLRRFRVLMAVYGGRKHWGIMDEEWSICGCIRNARGCLWRGPRFDSTSSETGHMKSRRLSRHSNPAHDQSESVHRRAILLSP